MSVREPGQCPKKSAEGRDLDDEYLIYDRANDQVHVLNGTAREIYLLCDGSRTVEQLLAAIVEKYGVDEATADRDIKQTLDDLTGLKVLSWD